MNTIHSSSLAFIPTGYIKPEQESIIKKPADTIVSTNNGIDNRLQASASTPEQVKTALTKSGLNTPNNFDQGDNSQANKALQIYAETRNQPAKTQLENMISRVDYYA
ncbi:MAG: hypothetical protein PHR94_02055 [Methylomonas lenta]|nr:hypothetical protein [Methylomonas lenta]